MRSVSFMNFVEFKLEGNVMSRAITMEDVNNDGVGHICFKKFFIFIPEYSNN